MQEKGQDIRITKTQIALSKTLMELLENINFQKITVNDICQRSMVSRSTFYLHFEDKYQLMRFCLQTERQRFDEDARCMEPHDYLHMFLTSVYERRKVFRNFLHAEIDIELFTMFKVSFHAYFSDILAKCAQQGTKLAGPIPLLAAYYENGLAGMVIWWIEHDCSISIDEMAACLYGLFSGILPNTVAFP